MMSPYLLLWVTTSLLMGGIIQTGLAMNLNRYQGDDKQELDYDEVIYGNKTVIDQTTHQNVTRGSAVPENLDSPFGKFSECASRVYVTHVHCFGRERYTAY